MKSFGHWAERAADNGFLPIPLNGKIPAIKNWRNLPPFPGVLAGLAKKKGDNNLGFRTGELIGIDIDCLDPLTARLFADKAQQLIGTTEFVRIGSWPKRVLFFRTEDFSFEPIKTLRVGQLDVLGAGAQVAVHGIHPDTGRAYCWPFESLLDHNLMDVPVLDRDGLRKYVDWAAKEQGISCPVVKPTISFSSRAARVGKGRNKALFEALIELAEDRHSEDDLLISALRFNRKFKPPLQQVEVKRIVESVWGYKETGRLFARGKQQLVLPFGKDKAIDLARTPGASALYNVLKSTRSGPEFTIPQRATARTLGWGVEKLRKAIKALRQSCLIEVIRPSVRKKGRRTPIYYRFTHP